MTLIVQLSGFNLLALSVSSWILFKVIQQLIHSSYATRLPGPTENPSFLYGYQLETITPAARTFIARLFGNGLLIAEGDVHRRQRKSLNPSFSPATIRGVTHVFFDAGYKVKGAWDAILDASTEDFATIEVQKWMTAVALDSIGMGGFSHDFGTLDGKQPLIQQALESFDKSVGNPSVPPITFIMGGILPFLLKLPIGRTNLVRRLKDNLNDVGTDLVERVRKERKIEGPQSGDKSVIGALIKSMITDADMYLSQEEIQGQNTLLIAGYVTTAVSMTVSSGISATEKLRDELLNLGPNDATYDRLSSPTTLPYLDAVVHEILRLHPAVPETARLCNQNDIVPLSAPITTRNEEVVNTIAIPKGRQHLLGPDAKEFRPERWLEPEAGLAKDFQSYRHILTFITGPRECLGKNFALNKFKSVLSLIIRHYEFELPDGPKTKIGQWGGLIVKPNSEGEVDGKVPMIVRRVH
ncbi:cytochrome P450 [Mycena floridula]|nr:cytochrome P450 [Mycena floridula]